MIITKEVFTHYDPQRKKDYLIGILQQLESNEILDENIKLLESDFPFLEATLNNLFELILASIQEGKNQENNKSQERVKTLNEKIKQEMEKAEEEAETLLHDIENLNQD